MIQSDDNDTVKPVSSGHAKKRRPKMAFKTDYRLMYVKSIASINKNTTRKKCAHLNHLCYCRDNKITIIIKIPAQNLLIRDLVKPVLSGHSKIDKTKVLKTNDRLMKVESTFDLH